MQRTANIYARIEPEIKSRAELVLEQLGIPLSNAIAMFLRQIVLQNGIPFEMKLPFEPPICWASLTPQQQNAELEKGYQEHLDEKGVPAEEVFAELEQEFGA
jgi:addiction module RelB/DinJ family antitoxin